MLAAVYVGTELAPFLPQLPDAREREYLEAAAVREDGALPAVEAVQASRGPEHLQPRAQVEVIGVAQYDLRLHLPAQLLEMHALHAAHRSHGHEDGRGHLAVAGGDDARAGVTARVGGLQLEFHDSAFWPLSSLAGMEKSTGCATISSVRAKRQTSATFST